MLTERQGEVLITIVQEYTATANPVSSGILIEKYFKSLSSATVRNEMVVLEGEGFLLKPHTSAGRIPSDRGYRYFVDNCSKIDELTLEEKRRLQVEMLKLKAQNVRLSRSLARTLSLTSKSLAISGLLDKQEYYDFGMHTLLQDPEFQELSEISKISASLDLIDERIEGLFSSLEEGETKVFIGDENPVEEMRKCSMIVSPYKLESGERGFMAIVGPKRMQYDRNKSLIDFIKSLLGKKGAWLITIGNINYLILQSGLIDCL